MLQGQRQNPQSTKHTSCPAGYASNIFLSTDHAVCVDIHRGGSSHSLPLFLFFHLHIFSYRWSSRTSSWCSAAILEKKKHHLYYDGMLSCNLRYWVSSLVTWCGCITRLSCSRNDCYESGCRDLIDVCRIPCRWCPYFEAVDFSRSPDRSFYLRR